MENADPKSFQIGFFKKSLLVNNLCNERKITLISKLSLC